jgi:hypothetical protein
LSYSDDEAEGPSKPTHRLTPAERDKRSRDIFERIPTAKESLWAHKMPWDSLSEVRPSLLSRPPLRSLTVFFSASRI